MASARSEQDLEKIFEGEPHLYVAFCEATEALPFPTLNQQAWTLAEAENGGFQEAATRYAQSLYQVQ